MLRSGKYSYIVPSYFSFLIEEQVKIYIYMSYVHFDISLLKSSSSSISLPLRPASVSAIQFLSPTMTLAFLSAPIASNCISPSTIFQSSLYISADLISFLWQTRVTVFPSLSQPLWLICYTAILLHGQVWILANQSAGGRAGQISWTPMVMGDGGGWGNVQVIC